MNRSFAIALMATASVTLLAGCKKSGINPNDSTKPTAELLVKDASGQYVAQQNVSMSPSSGQVDFICKINDPEGVQSVKISYVGSTKSCVFNGDQPQSGPTVPIKGLPAEAKQVLQGDSQGKVLTSLSLLSTLKAPLTCDSVGFPKQTGFPGSGEKVTIFCAGTNWSSNPNNNGVGTSLDITLK